MGTITIEEYTSAGTDNQREAQVPDLGTCIKTTTDATTSTTEESITLQGGTNLIAIDGVEKHRVSLTSSGTDDGGNYATVNAGLIRVLGATGTLYYRLDA